MRLRRILPDAHPFVKRLNREAYRQNLSFKEIGRRAGITGIKHWGKRDQLNQVRSLDAALNVLGLELCIREKEEKPIG